MGDFLPFDWPMAFSQPRGADGIRFGKRSRTPIVETVARKRERQRQDKRQKTEQAADQNTDAFAGSFTPGDLLAPNPETDLVCRQLDDKQESSESEVAPRGDIRHQQHRWKLTGPRFIAFDETNSGAEFARTSLGASLRDPQTCPAPGTADDGF